MYFLTAYELAGPWALLFTLLTAGGMAVAVGRWLTLTPDEVSARRYQRIRKQVVKLPEWANHALAFIWQHMSDNTLHALHVLGISRPRFTLLQLAVALAVGLGLFPLMPGFSLLLGAALGWFVPTKIVDMRYSTWQKAVMQEFPDFTEYLAVLFTIEMNIPDALRESLEVIEGPLQQEIAQLTQRLETDPDFAAVMRITKDRINTPEASSVLDTLIHAWSSEVTPDIFDSFATTMNDLLEAKMLAKTKRLPALFSMLPIAGLISMAVLFGIPFVMTLFKGFSQA